MYGGYGKAGKKSNGTCNRKKGADPVNARGGQGHRLIKVHGYGTYRAANGETMYKPQIILNTRRLAESGFEAGDPIDVDVRENELVIRKLRDRT